MNAEHWKIHACGVAAVALIATGAYALGVRPALRQRERLADLQSEIAAARDRVAQTQASEHELRGELDRLQALGAGWAALRGEPRTLNEQLAALATLAEQHGLRLTTAQPGEPERRPFFTVRRISLAGTGGYAPCAAFLRDLVDALPDVTVEGLTLTAAGSEKGAEPGFAFELAWYSDAAGAGATSGVNPG